MAQILGVSDRVTQQNDISISSLPESQEFAAVHVVCMYEHLTAKQRTRIRYHSCLNAGASAFDELEHIITDLQ
jgi:hypothetical protein